MKVNVEIDEVDIDKIVLKEMSILMADEANRAVLADKQSALYKAAKLIKEYYS